MVDAKEETTNGYPKEAINLPTPAFRSSLDGSVTEEQTALAKHCAFWDRDEDNVIWPLDTYRGFRELGFNLIISILSVFIIHGGFSYPTRLKSSYVPDPLWRIYLGGIEMGKHGSDTGSYDGRGYFQPTVFNSMFAKYAKTSPDGMTVVELSEMIHGQRVIMDPFGWFAAFFEWWTTALLTWNPRTGLCAKSDIRGIYDGSYFWHVKQVRDAGKAEQLPGMTFMQGLQLAVQRRQKLA